MCNTLYQMTVASVTYITNLDGDVVQHIEYVPFGEVFIEERNNVWNTPYLFNAKELDEETGMYYYGARYYDPRISLWISTDPLQEKYPNISTYCYTRSNPVRFIDPDGEEPTGKEAALMAKHVYGDDGAKDALRELNETGWKVSKLKTSIRDRMNLTKSSENGLQSQIYERIVDGKTEYAYAFAGTNSVEDVFEDVAQLVVAAPQYAVAIQNARNLSSELGSLELTFVGHSLGGGEAAAASMATGRKAITFNRASVSALTKMFHHLGDPTNVVNYQTQGENVYNTNLRVGGDPLTNFQNNLGFGAQGRNIPINVGKKLMHSIDEFLYRSLPSAK